MKAPRNIRIIVHGAHGDSLLLSNVVEHLREAGHAVAVRPTWEPGDAEKMAEEAVRLQADVVVAAGGDGTLHEVVNGLLHADGDAALGIIPMGTANDFARSARIPIEDDDGIARLLAEGSPRPVDLIAASDRCFINVATGGVAARRDVSDGMKRTFGDLAYLLSGVAQLTSGPEESISIQGPDFEWHGEFYGFAIANARCAGGGNVVCPEAVVDDGLLDIVVLPATQSLLQSTHIGSDLSVEAVESHVLRWRASWVHVRAEEPVRANMDGEPYQINAVRFEVKPGAVDVLLPDNSPLWTPVD